MIYDTDKGILYRTVRPVAGSSVDTDHGLHNVAPSNGRLARTQYPAEVKYNGTNYVHLLPPDATAFTVVGNPGSVTVESLTRVIDSADGPVCLYCPQTVPLQVLNDFWPVAKPHPRWIKSPADIRVTRLGKFPLPSSFWLSGQGDDILASNSDLDIPAYWQPRQFWLDRGYTTVVTGYKSTDWMTRFRRSPADVGAPGLILRVTTHERARRSKGRPARHRDGPQGYVLLEQAVSQTLLEMVVADRAAMNVGRDERLSRQQLEEEVAYMPLEVDVSSLEAGVTQPSLRVTTPLECEVRYAT